MGLFFTVAFQSPDVGPRDGPGFKGDRRRPRCSAADGVGGAFWPGSPAIARWGSPSTSEIDRRGRGRIVSQPSPRSLPGQRRTPRRGAGLLTADPAAAAKNQYAAHASKLSFSPRLGASFPHNGTRPRAPRAPAAPILRIPIRRFRRHRSGVIGRRSASPPTTRSRAGRSGRSGPGRSRTA